ncbi:hypothetical protein BK819_10970 [Microbacterium sp. LCT-H2]|nr:hypothetical protein BK819_10970 [Microbacterium sp. LCT-H2]
MHHGGERSLELIRLPAFATEVSGDPAAADRCLDARTVVGTERARRRRGTDGRQDMGKSAPDEHDVGRGDGQIPLSGDLQDEPLAQDEVEAGRSAGKSDAERHLGVEPFRSIASQPRLLEHLGQHVEFLDCVRGCRMGMFFEWMGHGFCSCVHRNLVVTPGGVDRGRSDGRHDDRR